MTGKRTRVASARLAGPEASVVIPTVPPQALGDHDSMAGEVLSTSENDPILAGLQSSADAIADVVRSREGRDEEKLLLAAGRGYRISCDYPGGLEDGVRVPPQELWMEVTESGDHTILGALNGTDPGSPVEIGSFPGRGHRGRIEHLTVEDYVGTPRDDATDWLAKQLKRLQATMLKLPESYRVVPL